MATKKYESMRIMSLEGSVVFKNDGFTATKDGKPDPKAFRGILDESLDTLKLAEVYDRHKSELAYTYLDGKKRFCRAVVSLSFNRAIKLYESYGNRYVLNGYSVTDADMQDHVCISTVGGKPTLIAIDVSFRENSGYAPVEKPIAEGILDKYFKYDVDTRSYKRSDKPIPTDISCRASCFAMFLPVVSRTKISTKRWRLFSAILRNPRKAPSPRGSLWDCLTTSTSIATSWARRWQSETKSSANCSSVWQI